MGQKVGPVTPGALDGLKVLELGTFISAPYCGKLMADLGAEVVKVEKPGVGDPTRRHGPFPGDHPTPETSGLFIYLNSGKLGITLDVETTGGALLLKELAARMDILVENTPVGFLQGLGLGYDDLRSVNPQLILVSITPFGQTGPYRHYRSNDLVASHIGGYAYASPDVKSQDQPPVTTSAHQTDLVAGLTGAVAAMSAVAHRRNNGFGQHLDISQQEAVASCMRYVFDFYTGNGEIPDRFGPAARDFGPHGTFPCKDGYISITCLNDPQWRYFKEAIGNPEWADSEVFGSSTSRGEYRDALEPMVKEWTASRTKEDIYRHMQAHHFPAFPVNTIEDFLTSPHFQAREFLVDAPHPKVGDVRLPRGPYLFAETPWAIRSPAPLLGQHNRELYCGWLEHAPEDLVTLRQAKVI